MPVVWIPVYIVHETDDAILIADDDESELKTWIPKSQIMDTTDDMNIGSDIEIEVPEWLAIEKELV